MSGYDRLGLLAALSAGPSPPQTPPIISGEAPGRWLLEVSKGYLDKIDLYIPKIRSGKDPSGDRYIVRSTGVARPFFLSRDLRFRTFVFKLPANFEEETYFYLRLEASAAISMPLIVWSAQAFELGPAGFFCFWYFLRRLISEKTYKSLKSMEKHSNF